MTARTPAPVTHNPFVRIGGDVVAALRTPGPYPVGRVNFDLRRTLQFTRDPLPILLGCYEEYGPIFTVRLLHNRYVFMLGPEANHYVTVSHADNFHWREGEFGQLIPLLGNGLLTIDEDYHDRARRIMMPAFHREQVSAAVETMVEETRVALADRRPGQALDVYQWMRDLAMRIAMRALLGLDPDDREKGAAAAHHFERALGYLGTSAPVRLLRGPGTPWRRMLASRRALDEIVYREIAHRRREQDSGRRDVLSLLLEARDEDGTGFSNREVRDQLMTLMFAGHDTSTSTVSFLLYELAHNPSVTARLHEEQDRVLRGEPPTPEQLERELPELEMVMDETLRLYPPAWIGPRRAVREFVFAGQRVPKGAYVNYCSWASHRIPEVFPEPEKFIPDRFTRDRKAALPKGAYVPFGGGSRICIGKRFGQTEVKLVTTLLLQRRRLDLLPGWTMRIRQMPTLSPRDGLPMIVRGR